MAGDGAGAFFTQTEGGVRLRVLATPKAATDGVRGLHADADGAAWLKVAVTAPPEGGKANAALIKLLAKRWGLAKGRFSVVAGESARRKTVLISDADANVMARLDRENDKATERG